jgi:hypothetical protein
MACLRMGADMLAQPKGDPLRALLAQIDPAVAAQVHAAPFRTVMVSAAWTSTRNEPPEVEAVVFIDGELTAPALGQMIELVEAAEDAGRAVIFFAHDRKLRDAVKHRVGEALAARTRAGGRA